MVNHKPHVSVIVPTYREAANIRVLVPRIADALKQASLAGEVIVVDDNSRDGTAEVCAELASHHPLRLVTRTSERGLATAVLRGLHEAAGEILVVMDADLSHPPEVIPQLVAACRAPEVDFAIGSRYVAGGAIDQKWTAFRRLNSNLATWLARGLTSVGDPMSGFFAIEKSKFAEARKLSPLGYKIGLELIVRCRCRRIVEIPIEFQDRVLGESKLSLAQQGLYLRHLGRLYLARLLMAFASPAESSSPATASPGQTKTATRQSENRGDTTRRAA